MNKLQQMIAEIRAGRVLSAKNESKLREAMQTLMDVLGQLEGDTLEGNSERANYPWQEQRIVPITGLELRAKDTGLPTVLGHAALFNTRSVYMMGFYEEIETGAFTETVATDDIRALYQHNTERVLGRTKSGTLRLWEDDQGLAFELNPPDNTDGRDAVVSIERGDVDQMSFGFNVPSKGDDWTETEDGVPLRKLRKIGVMEISPVTWAAYPQTGVGVMRSAPEWVQRALTQGVDDSSKAVRQTRARLKLLLKRHEILAIGKGI